MWYQCTNLIIYEFSKEAEKIFSTFIEWIWLFRLAYLNFLDKSNFFLGFVSKIIFVNSKWIQWIWSTTKHVITKYRIVYATASFLQYLNSNWILCFLKSTKYCSLQFELNFEVLCSNSMLHHAYIQYYIHV